MFAGEVSWADLESVNSSSKSSSDDRKTIVEGSKYSQCYI